MGYAAGTGVATTLKVVQIHWMVWSVFNEKKHKWGDLPNFMYPYGLVFLFSSHVTASSSSCWPNRPGKRANFAIIFLRTTSFSKALSELV